ncbi:MAG: PAS domain S-box protein [Rhodoferax sp.]|uniref:two-component system sensor histidine kinase NtrB n=1 Tax=Rhodoferax sp. TaxID=50421 RepID=UPI0026133EB4|nr:PAS domain S-box protein [Rhodoferax sp.]MDD5334225.1 PAS domain S-box protein [Rhodoferax sp.]
MNPAPLEQRPPATLRRRTLWVALLLLVAALLTMLVWLAGVYEASQVQSRLERDTAQAVGDLQAALGRNVQGLQALQYNDPTPSSWAIEAAGLLREHRELVRVEWRDNALQLRAFADTPFRPPVFERIGRDHAQSEVALACANARRISGPAYASSNFVPMMDGLGMEVMELCLPLETGGKIVGYLVASYALPEVLEGLIGRQNMRSHEISFTEGDGTRLAVRGLGHRGNRVFTAQQLMDLPGTTLVFRVDSWRAAPDLFPNVLTALVTAMSIALVSVLALLAKDMRRRLKAEHDLADALAFRKAMEDSLVTGMRARDLQGRITYVNPAFCQMVGFSAAELLGHGMPQPYWPPELVQEYQRTQVIRQAGTLPPREGFESLFMRKDGSRFPVLVIEAPLIDAQGVHSGWMSALIDISEQRRVEELSRTSQERLQASARLATLGEMASLLSHELNQPLAAISGYAAGSINLLRRWPDGAPQHGADLATAMQRIAEQAERAGKVIRSVHGFVRRRDQVREAVTPQALLDDILPLVNLQARQLSVRVQTEVEPDLSPVLCDRTMVEQVLLNLTRNAMQAMDFAHIVERLLLLRVRRAKGGDRKKWIEFAVADLGEGIAPEVRQQLFNPFFTTKVEGMGLGLSLCRTVVEQHGGALAFEPNLPRGTIFIFTLPADSVA